MERREKGNEEQISRESKGKEGKGEKGKGKKIDIDATDKRAPNLRVSL